VIAWAILSVFHYVVYSSLLIIYYLINTTILTFYEIAINMRMLF